MGSKIFKTFFSCDVMLLCIEKTIAWIFCCSFCPGRDIANGNMCWVKLLFVSHMTRETSHANKLRQIFAFAKISLQLSHSNKFQYHCIIGLNNKSFFWKKFDVANFWAASTILLIFIATSNLNQTKYWTLDSYKALVTGGLSPHRYLSCLTPALYMT